MKCIMIKCFEVTRPNRIQRIEGRRQRADGSWKQEVGVSSGSEMALQRNAESGCAIVQSPLTDAERSNQNNKVIFGLVGSTVSVTLTESSNYIS
jgi:hypothetical protein